MVSSFVRTAFAALVLLAAANTARAQAPSAPTAPVTPTDAMKELAGAWELSNADRDMTCSVTFKLTAGRAGLALDWDKACAGVFPMTKDVAAWTLGKNDAIQLLDARGRIVLELTEVETGLYEGLRPGDPLYFLQSQAALGGERTAEQMTGNWAFVRGSGRPLCEIALSGEAAGPDSFALTVKAGCDAAITGFAPKSWQFDRGQLVIVSAKGETWRFEEGDTDAWQRIPAGRNPLSLVRR